MGVAFSPDSALLASASVDGSLAVWRVQTREQLVLFHAPNKACCCVAFSPVVEATPPNGHCPTKRKPGGADEAKSEGEWLTPPLPAVVAGYADGTVRVFDVGKGRMVKKMQPHAQPVRAVAYFNDGRFVVVVVVVVVVVDLCTPFLFRFCDYVWLFGWPGCY